MTFLAPWMALLAAAVAIPALVLMYFLKLRRRDVAVPSTLLWRKAVIDMQASAPFQKLRRNLLLVLQLLVLIGLLFALARPTVSGWSTAGKRVVIVIDHSASMNATDVSPSRLERARELARDLVREATQGPGVMLISVAQEAQILEPFTADRDKLLRAIDALPATDQPGRLGPALSLIEQFARQEAGLDVYIISDGRFEPTTENTLQGQASVKLLRVGSDDVAAAGNLGIAGLSARRDYQNTQRVEVYIGIANSGPEARSVQLAVKVDGALATMVPVTAAPTPAGAEHVTITPASFTMDDAGTSLVEVALPEGDALATDNRAWVIVSPQRQLRALEVGGSRRFISRAIDAAGLSQVDRISPQQYESLAINTEAMAGYDLVVFDGYAPQTKPIINALYLGTSVPALGVTRVVEEGDARSRVVLSWRREHPVMRYAGLDELVLADSPRLGLPDDAQVLAMTVAGPLVAAVDRQGRRSVVVGFDPVRSNWPLLVGFPVFMTNVVNWLGAAEAGETGWMVQPGKVATLPMRPGASMTGAQAVYAGPTSLTAAATAGRLILPAPTKIGVYQTTSDRVEQPWDRVAVSLVDRVESDLRPVDQLVIGSQPVDTIAPQRTRIREEAHQWFLWAALAVLMGEWGLYVWRNRM